MYSKYKGSTKSGVRVGFWGAYCCKPTEGGKTSLEVAQFLDLGGRLQAKGFNHNANLSWFPDFYARAKKFVAEHPELK